MVPAGLTERLGKVATPLTAVAVSPPKRVALKPPPSDRVTLFVALVATLPVTVSIETWTAGAIALPAPVKEGCVVKTSSEGAVVFVLRTPGSNAKIQEAPNAGKSPVE